MAQRRDLEIVVSNKLRWKKLIRTSFTSHGIKVGYTGTPLTIDNMNRITRNVMGQKTKPTS